MGKKKVDEWEVIFCKEHNTISATNVMCDCRGEKIKVVPKSELEKAEEGGFRRGVEVQIGKYTGSPVPKANHENAKHFKIALLNGINGSMKSFRNDHNIKIPMQNSIAKRIAGTALNIVERHIYSETKRLESDNRNLKKQIEGICNKEAEIIADRVDYYIKNIITEARKLKVKSDPNASSPEQEKWWAKGHNKIIDEVLKIIKAAMK